MCASSRYAWLLLDPDAIRRAAGNPNGKEPLDLPKSSKVEEILDPKQFLRNTLETASGLTGRRLRIFRPEPLRVAELTTSFQYLRGLPAFRTLEDDLRPVLRGWSDPRGPAAP